jgi:hypothetical protein
VPVADRITLFYTRYPTGRILTRLISRTRFEITVQAFVFRSVTEVRPSATGLASERIGDGDVNTVACLENTETSAIGRALANLGLTASKHRPSREEMEKANRARTRVRVVAEQQPHRTTDVRMQRRADRATEVLTLLSRAIRLGFSIRKAAVLREYVARVDTDAATLLRIDRRLRDWLERRLDRVDWP